MFTSTGYIRHFTSSNRHDLSRFTPFFIDGVRYGYIAKTLAALLPQTTGVFETIPTGITLKSSYAGFEACSDGLMQATKWIAREYKKDLRNEMYGIVEKWDDKPVAQIDRIAVPWFGVRAWGVHVNGFVRKPDGIYLWVGERAADRPADPGKLDNLVGGGQPIGLTLEENLCKEAKEEAGIDAALALTAKRVRTINYRMERNDGLRSDTLFIYDLELPADFVPTNLDGEVASYRLMPLPEVAALVYNTNKFKFNCNLVIIDFMLRHGFITPQEGEYEELMQWLPQQ